MAIDSDHLRHLVIRPVTSRMGAWSLAAENLLLGTAAQESMMGHALKQYGRGPALGIYQMEPATFKDHFDTYLGRKARLLENVLGLAFAAFPMEDQLACNLAFATAMTRIHYLRIEEPLPHHMDWEGLGLYWDVHYNRNPNAGTVEEFVANVKRYVKHWDQDGSKDSSITY